MAETEKGKVRGLKARVCKVSKALMSVSEMVDAGNDVHFTKERSWAKHRVTGETVEFKRRNRVFEIDLKVRPYNEKHGEQIEKATKGTGSSAGRSLSAAPFR